MKRPPVESAYLHKVLLTIAAIVTLALGVVLVLYAADVFLLLFAGLLFGIFLKGAGAWIRARSRFSQTQSIIIFVVFLFLVLMALLQIFIPSISLQIDGLSRSLPEAFSKAWEALMRIRWFAALVDTFGSKYLLPGQDVLLGTTAPFITGVLGVIGGGFVVLATGFYFAIQADRYMEGFLRLVPLDRRKRVRAFFTETETRLCEWMGAQFLSMLFFGTVITIGLLLLNIPLALILGIMAGLLAFIPNFGFLLSLIPAVLVGFAHSPQMALYVLLLYAGSNIVETYFFTPWIQFRAVSLPPILVIFPQILMGILFGFLGLVLSTPLMLVSFIFVRYFYIEDILGDYEGDLK